MKETNCEVVRRELEELMLGDECSVGATQHLRSCGDCREFHQKQTRLRQIVGSLGTIEAPPDFDFKLRARLANESGSAGFHMRSMQWSFANRSFAGAAMLLLFVGGIVYVWTVSNRPETPEVAETRETGVTPAAPPAPSPEVKNVTPDQTPIVASNDGPRRRVERPSRPRRPLVAVDLASEGAPVLSNSQRHSTIFPIDASTQSLRFSFDDGYGNARTISVPTITFGSQRVLPNSNQFAQKGVW